MPTHLAFGPRRVAIDPMPTPQIAGGTNAHLRVALEEEAVYTRLQIVKLQMHLKLVERSLDGLDA